MATNTGHVMTLANSIIGVSVLAMPFCFKQCGITLAIIMLILSSITSRLTCHFLVKASSMCKRRNFEFLAFYTFGSSGKLLVELGIIGFMMGTCVAFFVVIGDLGPEIISKIFNIKNDSTLRSIVLLGLGLCVILPLGLLRNIESLAAISTVTIGFYFLLVVKIFLESFSHLLAGDWIQKVNFWQPEGVLQCIPIFAMALSCQTQIFEIYESLPAPTLDKMNAVVCSAVNICTIVYISVGLLGYIAYCTGNFTGNILLSFAPSLASEMYKLGFVMSTAVSFPLVIFPCRASLYSLIFRRMPVHHELSQTSSHIPDFRFKCLTVAIVGVSLITGLLIPSIELVLGFVGSTIGVAICVIFPALSFINLTNKETNERITAKITLLIGFVIMITGSLANYQAAVEVRTTEESFVKLPDLQGFPEFKLPRKTFVGIESAEVNNKQLLDIQPIGIKKSLIELPAIKSKPEVVEKSILNQKKEPPLPVAPLIEIKPSSKSLISPPGPVAEKESKDTKIINEVPLPDFKIEKIQSEGKINEEKINKDAIEREEREMQEKEKQKKEEEDRKQQELLQKLKEHQNEQKKLLQEQQNILIEMRNRESERAVKESGRKDVNKPVVEDVKPIKPEEFNKNIKKIQNVIDSLKDTQIAIQQEKRSEKEIGEWNVNELKPNIEPVMEKVMEPSKPSPIAENKESKDNMVKQKVAAVPLPLAKLQSQANVQNVAQEKSKAVVQSKQDVMGRDILENSKEPKILVREKRDIESSNSSVLAETIKSAKSGECAAEDIKQKIVDSVIEKSANKTENSDRENLKKDELQAQEKVTNAPEILIKNSLHISLGMQENNELKIGREGSMIIQADSVPKKRDLKSMSPNVKDPQSET